MESLFSHFRFAKFQFILKALDCINLPVCKGLTEMENNGLVMWGKNETKYNIS